MAHVWGSVLLRPTQREAFREIEDLLAMGSLKMPICLVGDFGSGKTTLARFWLTQYFENPEPYYCTLNRPLLDDLKRESELDHLVMTPAKTRLLLQLGVEDFLNRQFRDREALVLDCVEILQPYRVPLISQVNAHTRKGKVALLCVPDSPSRGFHLELRPFECHIVRLDSR